MIVKSVTTFLFTPLTKGFWTKKFLNALSQFLSQTINESSKTVDR